MTVDEIKSNVVSLFIQYVTSKEIRKIMHQEHGVIVSPVELQNIRDEFDKEIQEKRGEFLAKVNEVPIVHEKIRLERVEEMYVLSQKLQSKREKIKAGLDCLRLAREELDKTSISLNQYNQFNFLSDDELMLKKKELEKKFIELQKRGKEDAEVESGEGSVTEYGERVREQKG